VQTVAELSARMRSMTAAVLTTPAYLRKAAQVGAAGAGGAAGGTDTSEALLDFADTVL
jgi:hypothetical protein